MNVCEFNITTGQITYREYSPEELAAFQNAPAIDPTPKTVSMRQAGKLQAVNNAIQSMQGVQGEAARIEWDYSNEVRRDQPLTLALAQAIGMTKAEIDALFVTASQL